MSIDLKKAAKLALAAGATYMAVKDPEGALQVAGDLAGDATKQKEELIKQRGEQLAKDKEYFRQRADLLFANRQEQYRVDAEKTSAMNDALQSLASSSALGSTKREIALGALAVKGIIPSTGTRIETGSGLDLQLQNEMARIQEVVGEDGKVTGYKYIGNAMPVKPKLEDFYDESLITKAQEDISKGTFSTLSQKLLGKEDKGADVLAQLQTDMNSGYQKALDSPFRSSDERVEVDFKARPESSAEETSVAGTAIISKNSGKAINLNIPAAFPLVNTVDDSLTLEGENIKKAQTAVFKRIESNYTTQGDDASSPFTGNVFSVIQASVPDADLDALAAYDGSRIVGTSAEGAFLYNRTQSLKYEIVEANFHKAGWETGNDADNNIRALEDRLSEQMPKRILSLDGGGRRGVEGVYVIPTSVVALYEIDNIPTQVVNPETPDVPVETRQYLTEELNKILTANKGKTMSAVAPLLDARVAEILKPEQASEIKSDIPIISKDGNSFTINGVTQQFSKLDELIKDGTVKEENNKFMTITKEGEKQIIPDSVIEQYNIWLGTQQSGASAAGAPEVSIDNQMQEIVPDVSKMNLSEAMEKNLVTAEYLNNLSYEAPGGAEQPMFRTGGNNMMNVGDIITTKDGTKYESYPDTVVNEFDRPVTTIKFRPVTEE